jgi:short subunit dehydrogenase-like uncharacterized protein
MAEREHAVVLYGATGFTGGLVADYLAGHADADAGAGGGANAGARGGGWALAGRSAVRLRAVRDRLAARHPGLAELPLLAADADDPASLRRLAESARVVISTVGPYIRYGEGLVAACAAAGTDYVDLTGEPEFVDLMYLRHHAQALSTGARLVHACGFDSVPHDLGAAFTVAQLPEGEPLTVEGFVRAGGTISGGTFHSALEIMGRLGSGRRVAAQRRRAEPRPDDRRVRGIAGPPHRDAVAGGWVVPAPTIDPQVVLRSARALPRYGPDFRYGHWITTGNIAGTAGLIAGAGTLAALAQVGPARRALGRLRPPGAGPDEARRARSWFTVRFAGRVGAEREPRVVCEVAGGDPGYGETAKMLAESALCLAHDELPPTAGQVTTAQAMGDALTARLQRAGITFTVTT